MFEFCYILFTRIVLHLVLMCIVVKIAFKNRVKVYFHHSSVLKYSFSDSRFKHYSWWKPPLSPLTIYEIYYFILPHKWSWSWTIKSTLFVTWNIAHLKSAVSFFSALPPLTSLLLQSWIFYGYDTNFYVLVLLNQNKQFVNTKDPHYLKTKWFCYGLYNYLCVFQEIKYSSV